MKRRRKKEESGQAAIEFIVVVIVIFFFLFFLLSLSMAMVVSDYIEYATFMAARTYKSGFNSEQRQREAAEGTFLLYARQVEPVARNFTLQFINIGDGAARTAGVLTTYELDLFYLPPIFITGDDIPISRVTLRSEAVLGRDATFQECRNFFIDFSNRMGINIPNQRLINPMFDNGC